MPRRPDRIKASLWAGLICLCVFLTGPTRVQEATAAPVRGLSVAEGEAHASPPILFLTTQPVPPPKKTPSQGTASLTSRLCQPSHYQFLAGGILSYLLCHYVFGYPLRSVGQGGLWPLGLLDILVLAACCYLGYRLFRRLRRGQESEPAPSSRGFLRQENPAPPSFKVAKEAESGLAAIEADDPGFDLESFKEEAQGLLQEVYGAWNHQELEALNGRVKDGLLEYLRMGLKIMFLREESSYLEDLSLEDITVTAAGVNDGREFITVCFQGLLMDYVVDKRSGKLLVGSMAYPSTFKEFWEMERPRGEDTWVLQDIRET